MGWIIAIGVLFAMSVAVWTVAHDVKRIANALDSIDMKMKESDV